MPTPATVWRHLALAERHIAETEHRIAVQADAVRRLAPLGHAIHSALARDYLATLQETLAVMHYHRNLILRELDER